MSPQFVDYDQDGDLDIVAGTFDGSPHVALRDGKGWVQPGEGGILDGQGQRIVGNQFWNYPEKKWDSTTRCNPEGSELPEGHITSAFAWDWDADGDLDLLLGDYDAGLLYLRRNNGEAGKPSYASRNEVVLAGGSPLKVDKMSTPRMVDWNGDGLLDLLCGSMGDSYADGPGGGVFLFLNTGKAGSPQFGAAQTLVTTGTKDVSQEAPKRPDSGLYMDVADYDGDGDLDLVVGGYTRGVSRTSCVWLYENRTAGAAAGGGR